MSVCWAVCLCSNAVWVSPMRHPARVSLWESIPIMVIALPFVAILYQWQNGSAMRKHALRHHQNGLWAPNGEASRFYQATSQSRNRSGRHSPKKPPPQVGKVDLEPFPPVLPQNPL